MDLKVYFEGDFYAVTKCEMWSRAPRYRITHLKTGIGLGPSLKIKQAIRLAKILDASKDFQRLKSKPKTKATQNKYKILFQNAVEASRAA
jgi:hypothetical protein